MTCSRMVFVAVFAVASLVLAEVPHAGGAPATVLVTGTIQSAAPGMLVVAGAAGRTSVRTTGRTLYISRQAARLSDIKIGEFIGVDAKK